MHPTAGKSTSPCSRQAPRRRSARIAAGACLALVAVALLAGLAGPALAGAIRGFGASPAVAPPTGTGTPEHAALYASACLRPGSCLAGGNYQTKAGPVEPMIVRLAGRRGWPGHALSLRLPAHAPRQPYGQVNGLACTAKICIAVGDYDRDPAGDLASFIATGTGSRWARALRPALPVNAAPGQPDALAAVACTRAGWCEALGTYRDQVGRTEVMALAKRPHRPWGRATEVNPPAGAAAKPGVSVGGIACTGPGFCTGVGSYRSTHGVTQAMGLVERHGRWRHAVMVAAPRGAAHDGTSSLRSVSCPSARTCVAVGDYAVTATVNQAMSVTDAGGHFRAATAVTAVPAGAAARPTTDLASVSCPSARQCLAVGVATTRSGRYVAMDAVWADGRWRAAFAAVPDDARTGRYQGSELFSATCSPTGRCVLAGVYNDNTGGYRAEAATTRIDPD